MAHSFLATFQLPANKTGLASSLRAQLVGSDGANVGAVISSGFAELGSNAWYQLYLTSVPDGHWGAVKVYDVAEPATTLTAIPVAPTESENADVRTSTRNATTPPTAAQVRAEIDTNSAKLDVAVGTRLASSGYTAPPSAASIASAVWSAATRTLSEFGFTPQANATELAIKAITDQVATLMEADGGVYRFTTNALEQAPGGSGSGENEVDHDYGGTDALRVTEATGAGIDQAIIRCYLKAEYDAGTYNLVAERRTKEDGRWAVPMWLTAGAYVLTFSRSDDTTVTKLDLTVS